MNFMKWFVRIAGIYNASAVVVFLTPGALGALGVPVPESQFWTWLPGLLGLFAGIVLFVSSGDLRRYGSLPYYNGIIRAIFVIAAIAFSFHKTAGMFVGLLALGDIPLALLCIFGLPRALGKSHADLLRNNLS